MIPKIKMVEPMPDYKLKVLFDDGKTVIYNVKEDIETIESYKDQPYTVCFSRYSSTKAEPASIGMTKSICPAIPFMNMESDA